MRFFLSLLFSTGMILSTIVAALLLMLGAFLPFTVRARIARGYAAFVVASLKILCGTKYQVTGQENIPDRAAIIFCKHQSTWETYALQLLFPPQVWVLKRELMWLPFFGWGLALLKPISIDRGSGRKAVKQIIEQGKQRLAEGIWVTIFPEGTRVAPGQHKRWGLGGAILAEHSEAPIVPVAHNAGEFWGRRVFIKKPGTIQVIIGPPIEAKGRKAAEINQEVEAWMDSAMERISGNPGNGVEPIDPEATQGSE
jgi:1-acyl-sn-glycerol-3-phosphate acyltransferase